MTEYELCLREAEKTDAAELISFLNQVGSESDYMTLDEAGILMNQEEMASFIEHQAASSNQLYLLALLNGEIAGLVSITADFHERIRHIGQVFVVVKKASGIKDLDAYCWKRHWLGQKILKLLDVWN